MRRESREDRTLDFFLGIQTAIFFGSWFIQKNFLQVSLLHTKSTDANSPLSTSESSVGDFSSRPVYHRPLQGLPLLDIDEKDYSGDRNKPVIVLK